jgi:tetratricopeptide (TPR) repeat protein
LDIAGRAWIRKRNLRALDLPTKQADSKNAARANQWARTPVAPLIRVILTHLLFASICASQTLSAASASRADLLRQIRQLAEQQRWTEIVGDLEGVADRDADLDYEYGSALAQLSRLDDARTVFLSGHRLAPRDQRFPVELAGVAFKQKKLPATARWLRRALRINPTDSYANEFLATVYFLEGNIDAALRYWNRVGRPDLATVRPDPPLRVRPALLDRALAFSAASELTRAEFDTTRVRLEGLEIFPAPRIQLAARPDGKFDAVLNLQERNGWGSNVWQGLISTFSGVAYQTIYPSYFNLGESAINVDSLLRWDEQKRRLSISLSGPLHMNPRWRYRLGVDLRNENWNIRDSFTGPAPSLGALNLRRESAGASIESFNSGRWGWSAAVEFSHRDYRSVVPGSALTPTVLLAGAQLKQLAAIRYQLLHIPEDRLVVSTSATSQLGRIWSQPAHAFAKLAGSLDAHWFPQAQGDDYETHFQIRGGGTGGQLPFDELYVLGMERDNDLWMRAHIGTRDGRKGSAPLGTSYFLANSEVDKDLYGNGLIAVKLGPFLDSGKITDSSGNLGAHNWLWDTGLQAKLRVLGVGVTFVYGKDLRTGNNAFYFTAGRQGKPGLAGSIN